MRLIADLHIHSRFSLATSPTTDLPTLAHWAKLKGISLLGSGDFTHPQWFSDLQHYLTPLENGLYSYQEVLFLLTVEVSVIWSQAQRLHKAHLLILAPNLQAAAAINKELGKLGKLASNGRPTFGTSAERLVETVWSAAPTAEVIPAHIWTPWFSVFGSKSGFDSLAQCFGKYTDRIFAIETGLSSDPAMNWRLSSLDQLTLVSSSDAHSPPKLGREATLFNLPEPSYNSVIAAIKERNPHQFLGTIEFYPQEGKYHYDGHRKCGVVLHPREAMRLNNICPVCGRPLTIGVMHRVESLADRAEGEGPTQRFPARHLVPLAEIIAQALGIGPQSKGVTREYNRLIKRFGNEFRILLDLQEGDLRDSVPPRVLQGITKARAGDLEIKQGYDGVYGKISIQFDQEEERQTG
ncbi:DNA helicase UvrD [Candidatus Bipolaricaulota bacterium]|nr:DNA helicase UvrD [Candidatus Bipolaricaulota bacterium]